MDLWVRSQDKRNLILAKDIVVSKNVIRIYKETELYTTVAIYKTEERALEVLDEIQNTIKPTLLFKNVVIDEETLEHIKGNGIIMCQGDASVEQVNQTIVYQMPEE